ncbi:AraC-like DNA-binding protein [Nitrobacteraceae bacterium AZCC 2146]
MLGLTKARSMGSVAGAVERAGGNVARVFSRADLPLRLIDQPDRLILLRDQLRLVECAAREIGDPALSARLSLEAGVAGLGALGQRVLAADQLDAAITHANMLMGSLLQSSTHLQLIGTTFEAVLSTALERQATTMLERRDCSISQIAYELGYADPAHFTRAFVAWKGISPRAWRFGWERNTARPQASP